MDCQQERRCGGVRMRKHSLIGLALLAWALALGMGAAQKPAAPVKPAVQALLARAAKEAPAAALATLARAEKAAGADRSSLLAVAATAHRLGQARQDLADYPGAERFHRRALAI